MISIKGSGGAVSAGGTGLTEVWIQAFFFFRSPAYLLSRCVGRDTTNLLR